MIRIIVGSRNPTKIAAVEAVFSDSGLGSALGFTDEQWLDRAIESYGAMSYVREQPLSLEETICGARSRAMDAYLKTNEPDVSIGIESGVFHPFEVKLVGTTHGRRRSLFDLCAVAIFLRGGGPLMHVGLSSAWHVPDAIAKLILEDGLDMDEASLRAGVTDDPKLGRSRGLIGLLSGGRVTREDYTKQAIEAAILSLSSSRIAP